MKCEKSIANAQKSLNWDQFKCINHIQEQHSVDWIQNIKNVYKCSVDWNLIYKTLPRKEN